MDDGTVKQFIHRQYWESHIYVEKVAKRLLVFVIPSDSYMRSQDIFKPDYLEANEMLPVLNKEDIYNELLILSMLIPLYKDLMASRKSIVSEVGNFVFIEADGDLKYTVRHSVGGVRR